MHIPVNTVISFAVLISIVGGSYYYVYATDATEPWLGIEGSNVTPSIAQTLGLQEPMGFLIFSIEPGSPGVGWIKRRRQGCNYRRKSGRAWRSIIIAVDDIPIQDAQDIEAQLINKAIGDVVEFSVIRGNSTQNIEVELGRRYSSNCNKCCL